MLHSCKQNYAIGRLDLREKKIGWGGQRGEMV